MAEATAADSHEVYIWSADDLLEDLKGAGEKGKEGVKTLLEYNEKMKNSIDADVVAVTQLMQANVKIARQIKLLGITGRAYIKEVAGKKYIIFKGDAKLRPNLKGTRYLAENAKVRCFVVGTKDILEDAAKGTKVAIIAFVAIDVIKEVTSDHPSFVSLGVNVTSDVLQAVTAAYAGAAAGVFLTTMIGAPVVVTFVAVVLVGFTVGVVLTSLDNKYKMTERCRARMMGWEQELEKEISYAKSKATAASREAYQASKQYIKSEAIKIDKYYQTASNMLGDSYLQSNWAFMP